MPNASSNNSSSSNSSVPSIRTFQMDASSVGILKSSVNLFRGDVNYTQKLFSMPGRNSNDGLEVDISIQYQSNINRQVATWNRDQPTSIVGLGWDLPLSAITLNDQGAPTPGLRSYTLTTSGFSSQLVRDRLPGLLFNIPMVSLTNGMTIPTSVRNAFVQTGLPLSANAIIVGSSSPWVIQDDALEREYTLVATNGQLAAYDGGESYQLVSYKFWKIIYYPRYERWQVINDAGFCMSYGGGVTQTQQGYQSSLGNSVEWGVQWIDSQGIALWQGNSIVATGQQQFAKAWHLTRAYSRFGEYVSYGYNEFIRDSNGLLPDVEQLVSVNGKPFTKACYLTSVTDVFGRKALFNYAPKLWSNASLASSREYADPHKTEPNSAPNGFQDCYETYFLDHIAVQHVDGSTLFSVQFDYQPTSNSAVVNLANDASGDTCKRLLTEITLFNSTQQNLPGFKFNYYLTDPNSNLGALKSITWPSGGVATYAYQAVSLDICQRSLSLSPPTPELASMGAMPRVWFGNDYAVVMWYGSSAAQLSLQILTWNGQWNNWQPDPNMPLLLKGSNIDLKTLNVLTSQDFVAISYQTSTNTNLHLFRTDPARPAQWVAAALPAGGSGNCNDPSWTWPLNKGQVTMMVGKQFLLATQMSTSQNSGSYDVFTWNWAQQNWTHTQTKTQTYTWFANGSEYFATVDMKSNVQLNYLNSTGDWLQNQPCNLGFSLNNFTSLALTTDVSMLAISHLTSGSPSFGQYVYDVYPVQWNSAYQFAPTSAHHFTDKVDSTYPTSWAPVIVSNSLIAVAANLLRFNGQTWLANSNLKPKSWSNKWQQRFSYGPDYAVMIYINPNGSGMPAAQLVSYDASSFTNDWTNTATPINGLTNPPRNASTANWSSANNPDYLTVGSQLFFRDTTTDWSQAIQQPISDLQNVINQAAGTTSRYQVNDESMINQGPNFIACAVYDTQSSSYSSHANACTAFMLRNGGIYGAAEFLNGEQMWTDQEGDAGNQGTSPAGPFAFVTYPSSVSKFDMASSITLHHYAGDAIQGAINDWPVCNITIDDGLSETSTTCYVPDTSTAGCDASGEVIKYFKNTVYPGGSPDNPINGSVVSCYLNGNQITTGDNFYNALDGLLHSVTCLDATANVLVMQTNTWTVYTQRASHPTNDTITPMQLYGAYVLQTRQDVVKNTVQSSTSTSYIPSGLSLPYTGQAANKSTITFNGNGQSETDTQTLTYACEVNPASLALNDVSSPVAQISSCAGIVVNATATALSSWPSQWDDVLIPAEEADFSWTGSTSQTMTLKQSQLDSWHDTPSSEGSQFRNDQTMPFTGYGHTSGESQFASAGQFATAEALYDEPDPFSICEIMPTMTTALSTGTFPFADYTPGQTPVGWQSMARILQRQKNGTLVEQIDGASTPQSFLFSEALGLPIATFKGASLAECAWNNFQSYQDQSTWSCNQTTLCTNNAWLGIQSLCLPNHASSLSTAVTPTAKRTNYLLGCRYQTPKGYNANNSGWTVSANGKTIATIAFTDTQGQWLYCTTPISCPSGTSSLTITAVNQGSADVLIDSVLFVPFGTEVTVQSWYADTRLLKASMNAAGNVSFLLYDNFSRVLGSVGADGQLQELDIRFQSRQSSTNDAFDNASPNAELTLQMDMGGIAETFNDGGQWCQRWQPGNAALWKINNGILCKNNDTADTLTWKNSSEIKDVVFFIEFTPLAALAGPIALQFGQGQAITWTLNQGWSWTDAQHNHVQAALATPTCMATQWLLLLTENTLLFFGNGQLIFSQATTATAMQGCAFSTGNNPLQINNMGFGVNPRLGLSYNDGAARQRQIHQFNQGDSRIVEMVYDALDRKIALTRAAPGSFGSGASIPTMQYRDTFLDVQAFLSAWQTSCAMTGDIAAYYAGQSEGSVSRSNDQNYPYTGWRYEACAQKRIVESGRPGLQLAIHDVNTTTPAQRQTTRNSYTASNSSDHLPAGQYYAQNTTTPSGYQVHQLINTVNCTVSMAQIDTTGNNSGQIKLNTIYSDTAGAVGTTGTLQLPNAFTNGPQVNPQAFVRTIVQNSLGQLNAYTDPDASTTQFLFDSKGLSRFINVPLEHGENYFLYTKYDALGRLLEEGTVHDSWNTVALEAQVDNLDYPSAADGATIARSYSYDGDGFNPNNLGKLTQVITFNPPPASNPNLGACTVTENWSYDALGRVQTASMTITGPTDLNVSATYHYNNLNEVTQIDFSGESPLPSIVYSYDDQSQVKTIGTPDDPTAIASYSWSADGQLQGATRGALTEAWGYDSPGNVLVHSASINNKTVFAQQYCYTPDHQIQSRATTMSFPTDSWEQSISYTYNGQQQFETAKVTAGTQLGNLDIIQCDANGNIYSTNQDGQNFSFAYTPGTNRLISSTLAQNKSFSYRNDGYPSQWRGMQMEYDAALGMALAVTNGQTQVRYARGFNNHRVLRQSGNALCIRFYGAGDQPLIIWNNGTPQVCVWGANGLAAVHNGALQYPIVDHQNTVWAVTDSVGNLAASYNYLPFGGIASQSGTAASDWLFQYAGKSWDPDLELYDFEARLYDPALLRFVMPDTMRQYASPYIFAGNNPLNKIDPSGDISIWAQIGIGLAMIAVAAAGLALSMFTGGTSDAAAGAADAALAGVEAGADAATDVAADAAVDVAADAGADAGADAAADTASAAADEVSTGASSSAETASSSTSSVKQVIAQNAKYVLRKATASGLKSAGTAGLKYDINHGRDFTAQGFFEAMGIGFMGSFISSGIGGLASMPTTKGYLSAGKSATSAVLRRAAAQAVTSAIGKDISAIVVDAVTQQPITATQLLCTSAKGFLSGAVSGAFSAVSATTPATTAITAVDKKIVKASNFIEKVSKTAEAVATSDGAIGAYFIGGGLLVPAVVWYGLKHQQ